LTKNSDSQDGLSTATVSLNGLIGKKLHLIKNLLWTGWIKDTISKFPSESNWIFYGQKLKTLKKTRYLIG
jgi:hypothetical protein